MYGSISWGAIAALLVFVVVWNSYFNVHNGRAPRLPRWMRRKPAQKGLMPPSR